MLRSAVSFGRFGGLDGLRALAVALVLVYHFFPDALPGGFLGVDVFFVISGFLITSLLLRERDRTGRINLVSFWRRRARRLLPALALLLLVCTSLAVLVGGDLLVGIGGQIVGAAVFVSNWVFIVTGANYFALDTPELFRNTWSLAIEEQFYIVLPLVLILLLKRGRRSTSALALALLGTASAALMALSATSGVDATRIYFGSDTHTFGLLWGAALAFAAHPAAAPSASPVRLGPSLGRNLVTFLTAAAGLAVLGALAFTLPEASVESFTGGFQLATVAAIATVWAITREGVLVGRLLDLAPLRWVGERSYGIYLWHWPLLLLVTAAAPAAPRWQIALVTALATVLIAAVSFEYLEQPVRRLGVRQSLRLVLRPRLYTPRRRGIAIGVTAMLAVAVPTTGFAVATAPAVSSGEAAVARGAAALEAADDASTDAGDPSADPEPGTSPTDSPNGIAPGDGTAHEATERDAEDAPPVVRFTGADLSAIGDSVMLASSPELGGRFPGIDVDAEVSRSMGVGVGIVGDAAANGRLRNVLVIGLGTNGPVDPDELESLRAAAGDRPLVLVNAHADRDWIDGVNATLTTFADRYRGVVVADWTGSVASDPDALAGDGIHPNPSGGEIYAASVEEALEELDSPAEAIGFTLPRR